MSRLDCCKPRVPLVGAVGKEKSRKSLSRLDPLQRWKTSNLKHPTSNLQRPRSGRSLDVGCWRLEVGGSHRFMGKAPALPSSTSGKTWSRVVAAVALAASSWFGPVGSVTAAANNAALTGEFAIETWTT